MSSPKESGGGLEIMVLLVVDAEVVVFCTGIIELKLF